MERSCLIAALRVRTPTNRAWLVLGLVVVMIVGSIHPASLGLGSALGEISGAHGTRSFAKAGLDAVYQVLAKLDVQDDRRGHEDSPLSESVLHVLPLEVESEVSAHDWAPEAGVVHAWTDTSRAMQCAFDRAHSSKRSACRLDASFARAPPRA